MQRVHEALEWRPQHASNASAGSTRVPSPYHCLAAAALPACPHSPPRRADRPAPLAPPFPGCRSTASPHNLPATYSARAPPTYLFLAAAAPPAPTARRPPSPIAPSAEAVSREPSCSWGRRPLTYGVKEARRHQCCGHGNHLLPTRTVHKLLYHIFFQRRAFPPPLPASSVHRSSLPLQPNMSPPVINPPASHMHSLSDSRAPGS